VLFSYTNPIAGIECRILAVLVHYALDCLELYVNFCH